VWHRLVPNAIKAKWFKLYAYYIRLSQVKPKDLKAAHEGVIAAGSISGYAENFAEVQKDELEADPLHPANILDECLSHIHDNFKLDEKALEMLIASGDDLSDYWPTIALDISEPKLIISEYGGTNPLEFFSEAFRVYLEGKAPKRVRKLMEYTLKHLQVLEDDDESGDEED
jgi:hypothetical protein